MIKEITCPHCGSDDWWSEDEDDIVGGITKTCHCADCDKEFSVTFETVRIEKF